MEDQSKFFNVVIDKTNQKLNSFQAQVIVLESQLQMAIDERDAYKKYVDSLPSLNFNITELNNKKNELEQCQGLLNNSLEELNTYKQLIKSLEDKNAELELRVNTGSTYLQDQNETLLQEIRRLNSEVANLSSNR
jgi:chromosome segregation ATPase